MALHFQFGTVQIEATQLADEVFLRVSDKFGMKKEFPVPGMRVEEIPMEQFAACHARWSQIVTRRN